jgi:hypothetical protein
MINLISTEKKKKNLIDFYYRFAIIVFFAIGILVGLTSILILPSYILTSSKKNLINQKLEIQKMETIPKLDEETLLILNSLNSKLDLIEKIKNNKYIVSQKAI